MDKELTFRDVDTIVHLGAGKCSELANYLAASPRRIVLVEADPQAVRALERRCVRQDNVEVWQQAVAPEAGEHTLHVFNAQELSSLRPGTALQNLYPGIRQIRQESVDAITPGELIEQLDIQPGAHCLVVDTPGEEYQLLEALQSANLLDRFDRIVLRCAKEPLYDSASPAEDSLTLLREQGYETAVQAEDTDPDWPEWTLRLNPLKPELDRQRAAAETLRAERDQLQAQVADRGAEVERLTRDVESVRTQKQGLEVELKKEREARASLDSQIKEVETRADAAQADRDKLQEQLTKESGVREAETERLQNDLGVALRLQSVRDADLKELQSRYGQLLDAKRKQDELLLTLTSRLNEASEHLKRIESGSIESEDGREIVGDLVNALTEAAYK